MTDSELARQRFEFDSKMAQAEFDLKQKELDLKIEEQKLKVEEQKSRKVFTPLVLSIAAGFISLMTSIISNRLEHAEALELENRRLQSSLLIKASEAKDYTEFAATLSNFHNFGLLDLTDRQLQELKKDRLRQDAQTPPGGPALAYGLGPSAKAASDKSSGAYSTEFFQSRVLPLPELRDSGQTSPGAVAPKADAPRFWAIVSGADANLQGAADEVRKAQKLGLPEPFIYLRSGSYRLCIGRYNSAEEALTDLVTVKDRVNTGAYVVELGKWCPNSTVAARGGMKLYTCR